MLFPFHELEHVRRSKLRDRTQDEKVSCLCPRLQKNISVPTTKAVFNGEGEGNEASTLTLKRKARLLKCLQQQCLDVVWIAALAVGTDD